MYYVGIVRPRNNLEAEGSEIEQVIILSLSGLMSWRADLTDRLIVATATICYACADHEVVATWE